jgi:integrase
MKGSGALWIKYHRNGKPIRESTHTTQRKKAEHLLRKRLAEISTGAYLGPKLERIRMTELADDLVREYRINERKSVDDLVARWTLHLKPFFGVLRAVEVSSSLVARYIDSRQQGSAANATINRELAALKRMFNLARQATPPKVNSVPYIAMLKENNVRTGFLEGKEHEKLAAECARVGIWLRSMFEVGCTYGWRHQELLALRVQQVNLLNGSVRLEPGTTKNDEGREVTMTRPVRDLLRQCVLGKAQDDYVFTRNNGQPVRDFRASWGNACCAAGVGQRLCRSCGLVVTHDWRCVTCGKKRALKELKYVGLLFHDLRRTGARNLRRAGVAEGVIQKIGGWKTRSVFERYAIVDQRDIADAMNKLEIDRENDRKQSALGSPFGQGFGQSGAEIEGGGIHSEAASVSSN